VFIAWFYVEIKMLADTSFVLQMILYDTPGVIEKKMHRLDTMMMKNVRDAAINADCVVILVDACKTPTNVCFSV